MQDLSQVKAYSEADFTSTDAIFVLKLEEILLKQCHMLASESLIIDLGCGPGNISELVALRWPCSQVIGFDGSAAMISLARARKEKIGISNLSYVNCELSQLNLQGTPYGLSRSPALIISNSLLHHLHNPILLWQKIKSLAEPGTISFHRDLRRPLSLEIALGFKDKYLANAPKVLANDYVASLQAAFTVEEVSKQLESQGLENFQVFEEEDRYLEVFGTF